MDLDDYWVLESGHIMYRHYLSTKLDEQIREHIRLADHVTTTTEHLAQKIRLLNKAVTILPNEPYEAYQQYLPDTNAEPEPHLFKIGWFGGAQHQEDIALVEHSFSLLAHDKSLDGRYKIYLGGWNDGNPVYDDYERMLSCRGLVVQVMQLRPHVVKDGFRRDCNEFFLGFHDFHKEKPLLVIWLFSYH